jgi:hypothetical protein
MPSLRTDGFLLFVRTRGESGHRPHVHVRKGEQRCTILLDETVTPYNVRMKPREVMRARRLVKANSSRLQKWWNLYNG